jgi:hypothetical protein
LEGVVLISERNFPVPVSSPLQNEYRETLEELQKATTGLDLRRFDSLSQLYVLLDELAGRSPFSLKVVDSEKEGKEISCD